MRQASVLALALFVTGCGGALQRGANVGTSSAGSSSPRPRTTAERLKAGIAALEASRYRDAESDLRAAAESPSERAAAELGLSELYLVTGRYDDVIVTADAAAKTGPTERIAATSLKAEAFRRQGKLEEAEAAARAVANDPKARRARLLLGEVLLEQGKRKEAEAPLMTLVDDYNSDRIAQNDGRSLAMVGRAAHLLRYPKDANDAFNEAERAVEGEVQTLLWRAELFLEKYDPGHAEEVIHDILEKAPNHPEANVWLAQVKLAQSLDFDEAERLARKALEVNPKLGGAHFVLTGIALRDMDLVEADARADAGLRFNPRDLDLLSAKATIRFLADDRAGFEKAKRRVLELNPLYTRMYQILGDYADWEHRYDEIVAMMREAVAIDAQDANALAALGLNLLRAGSEAEALSALRSSFDKDPFNVRVYNTLNLYEKDVANNYVTEKSGRFVIRYHKEEKPILERYVPDLLERAWTKFVKGYGFTPTTPVGIELYAERPNFAIRTSGLPNTAIQGVCFGRTLAAMSPKNERFNLGMTLWHELAHVFHIQESKSRVPRWFTEGLAEYETLAERPEWAREQDPDLYEALRTGRLPQVGNMNRAFTRAEELSDVAMAYYASSQILVMLARQYGMDKLSRMLALWGESKPTPQVLSLALGVGPDDLDRNFRAWASHELDRYNKQFMPVSRTGPIERARADAESAPRDSSKQTLYALALFRASKLDLAEKQLARALAADPKNADARYLSAELLLAKRHPGEAEKVLRGLISDGRDGYSTRMLLAGVFEAKRDVAGMKSAFEAASRFDPKASDPLGALSELARQGGRIDEELDALRKLALLEQHDPTVYRRLLHVLVDRNMFAEARRVGQAAIWADIEGLETHVLYAEALAETGALPQAAFELETAVLCPGRPGELGDAHARLAEVRYKQQNRALSAKHAAIARQLDPKNPRLQHLPK